MKTEKEEIKKITLRELLESTVNEIRTQAGDITIHVG